MEFENFIFKWRSLLYFNVLRPLKINCIFDLKIFWKSYARMQKKNNTNHPKKPIYSLEECKEEKSKKIKKIILCVFS